VLLQFSVSIFVYGFGHYVCRQGAAGSKGQRHDPERRGVRESRAVPAPDANAELVVSMQVKSLLISILSQLAHLWICHCCL